MKKGEKKDNFIYNNRKKQNISIKGNIKGNKKILQNLIETKLNQTTYEIISGPNIYDR